MTPRKRTAAAAAALTLTALVAGCSQAPPPTPTGTAPQVTQTLPSPFRPIPAEKAKELAARYFEASGKGGAALDPLLAPDPNGRPFSAKDVGVIPRRSPVTVSKVYVSLSRDVHEQEDASTKYWLVSVVGTSDGNPFDTQLDVVDTGTPDAPAWKVRRERPFPAELRGV